MVCDLDNEISVENRSEPPAQNFSPSERQQMEVEFWQLLGMLETESDMSGKQKIRDDIWRKLGKAQ